jgi:hypothetical protein
MVGMVASIGGMNLSILEKFRPLGRRTICQGCRWALGKFTLMVYDMEKELNDVVVLKLGPVSGCHGETSDTHP